MNPLLISTIIVGYFAVLILISFFTSKHADTNTFFTANRQSPWYLVAFGMIGASLSGITFISVPGEVGNVATGEVERSQFSYFQVVLGYLLGYFVIARFLLPLYYRMNLITIYTYLEERFGKLSYKTGSFFFLLSRTIGAAFRLFLVAMVLQIAIFEGVIAFEVTVLITIALIWIYTFKGGIKTIVWTDTLQTLMMLLAVVITIYLIAKDLNISMTNLPGVIADSEYSKIFFWEGNSKHNFFKQFFSGAFIAIVMTGLDQDMMQKNLTCRNLKESQKNMYSFSIVLIFVNLLFLSMGALLYLFAEANTIEIPIRTDELYPLLAINYFPAVAGILFLLGIIAAAYSSADSALTALTTSFCVDFIGFSHKEEKEKKRIKTMVHIGFSILLFLVIVIFRNINDDSLINNLFKAAGFTYGPLLGLFAFGMFTKYQIRDKWAPAICVAAPVVSYLLDVNAKHWLGGFEFGFSILMVNGLLTFLGLYAIRKKIIRTNPPF